MTGFDGTIEIFNWRDYGIFDEAWTPMSEQITRALERLDGDDDWGFALSYVPPEKDFRLMSLREFGMEWLQSGGTAEAMTVEVKRREDGDLRIYAVARDQDERGTRDVSWASNDPVVPIVHTVPANEVFTALEADPIFQQYALTRTIPDGYRLRLLDL